MDKVISAIDNCAIEENEVKRLLYNGKSNEEIKSRLLDKKSKFIELFSHIVFTYM